MRRSGAVAVPWVIRREILAHARRERPRECCGLLLGSRRTVMFAVPMENVDETPATRYRIGDGAHIELRRAVRRFVPSLEIMGVYHSHPAGEPQPSAADLAEALYPDWLYLIVGLRRRGAIRGYRIRRGMAAAVRIVWTRRPRSRP